VSGTFLCSQRWITWYRRTQSGAAPNQFRWRGRDPAAGVRELNPKVRFIRSYDGFVFVVGVTARCLRFAAGRAQTLTSGLDDYPRASHPTDNERHVDLFCWLDLADEILAEVRLLATMPRGAITANSIVPRQYISRIQLTGRPEAHSKERTTVVLDALHWDAERGVYADWGLHTENVALRRVPPHNRVERVVGDAPVDGFVPHFGYVSLFPLLLERLRTAASSTSRSAIGGC